MADSVVGGGMMENFDKFIEKVIKRLDKLGKNYSLSSVEWATCMDAITIIKSQGEQIEELKDKYAELLNKDRIRLSNMLRKNGRRKEGDENG